MKYLKLHKKSLGIALACFASGILCALALPPWHIIPFYFIGFFVFTLCMSHTNTGKSGFIFGWLFSFAYFVIGLSWVGNALLVDGNKFSWAWPLAVCALPAALALFNATSCFISARYLNLTKPSGLIGFIALFALSEFFRSHFFTGFPWNLHAMIWAEHISVLQILRLIDIHLLSFFTILLASSFGFLFLMRSRASIALLGVNIFIAGFIYYFGQQTLNNAALTQSDIITIKVVQPNIQQNEKWKRDKMRSHFDTLLRLSEANGDEENTTLIVWPETATTYGFLNDPVAREMIQKTLRTYSKNVFLITGVLLKGTNNEGHTNSIVSIDKNGGIINRYDKSHLVPFGEYIPFQNWIPLETVTRFSSFERGKGPTLRALPTGHSFSPLICYEIIFPYKAIAVGSNPNFIINVTNDGWYGDSAGPYQHFAIARYRAVENGITVIRSANTGISGVIDAHGRVINKIAYGQESVLQINFSPAVTVPPVSHLYKNLVMVFSLLTFIGFAFLRRRIH